MTNAQTKIAELETQFRASIEAAMARRDNAPEHDSAADMVDSENGVPGRISDGENLRAFILAGRAVFTIRSQKTQARFTFRVTRNTNDKYRASHWVNVLTGPDNTSSYTRLGSLYARQSGMMYYGPNDGAPIGPDAPSAVAMMWVWKYAIARGVMPPGVEVWHEGRCARCARALTDPDSIESGFGPICRGKAFACE